MKLKFKVQPYQTMAVDAVVDCFAGQPFSVGPAYRIDPGKRNQAEAFDDEGFRNPDIALTDAQLLTNINAVQRRQNLPQSPSLTSFVTRDAKGRAVPAPAAYLKNMVAAAPLHLDVEMETGTGKTYCYIKTMFELNRRYGWSKFIIIVPSIAIREGVAKSLSITAEHFTETYGKKARFFIYGDLSERDIRRIQIRETIRAHLEKERQLFAQGVKVLSLFFIDEVAKYRDYSRDDQNGEYARMFEEEYAEAVALVLAELPLDEAAWRKHLEAIPVAKTHDGYFSIDKKTKRLKDPGLARGQRIPTIAMPTISS